MAPASARAAPTRLLSDEEFSRGLQATTLARALVNPSIGILGVASGKSNDRPGESAVVVYVDENMAVSVPSEIGGARTIVIPTNARAVATGSAPTTNFVSGAPSLPPSELAAAIAVKQQYARNLMQQNPEFFGIGVGQSIDNPREASLIVYVDKRRIPALLPQAIGGLRTRYVFMSRLHVTRSYSLASRRQSHCVLHRAAGQPDTGQPDTEQPDRFDPTLRRPLGLP